MAAKKSFRATLEGCNGSQAARFTVPFDAEKIFGTRARVPVRGTINGHPFRSSIYPTGGGSHYMVVNRETREGAVAELTAGAKAKKQRRRGEG